MAAPCSIGTAMFVMASGGTLDGANQCFAHVQLIIKLGAPGAKTNDRIDRRFRRTVIR
jgi:hypothetical protein